MKIMTVAVSPYLLTSAGRLNQSILKFFLSKGHTVSSAVWGHDTGYFMSDEIDGKYYYEEDSTKICELFPFINSPEIASVSVYESMKKFMPDIVISIGNENDVAFVCAIKDTLPGFFKWIGILTSQSPMSTVGVDVCDSMDFIIVTTSEGLREVKKVSSTSSSFINPGYNNDVFTLSENVPDKFSIIANLRNNKLSNIPALLSALSMLKDYRNDFEAYLHTNIDDSASGFDIRSLVSRYGLSKCLRLPMPYSCSHYGISDLKMRDEYCSASVYVDPSMDSLTGACLLEAMGCGCVPITVKAGACWDILQNNIDGCFASSSPFVDERGDNLDVISDYDLFQKLKGWYDFFHNSHIDGKIKLREKCADISKKYKRKFFEDNIYDIVLSLYDRKRIVELAVDCIN